MHTSWQCKWCEKKAEWHQDEEEDDEWRGQQHRALRRRNSEYPGRGRLGNPHMERSAAKALHRRKYLQYTVGRVACQCMEIKLLCLIRNPKSANFLVMLVRNFQIRKFLLSNPQIVNPQWSSPQIANLYFSTIFRTEKMKHIF